MSFCKSGRQVYTVNRTTPAHFCRIYGLRIEVLLGSFINVNINVNIGHPEDKKGRSVKGFSIDFLDLSS
jgi:hypothetical protein